MTVNLQVNVLMSSSETMVNSKVTCPASRNNTADNITKEGNKSGIKWP